ncbi:LysR family transcriptional regulator [Cognatishimia activa]|uniref:LysR family transcriptional regulator n=1 Tax=Cognatishimia activa TaxID=1715691 RepID=UPI002232ADD9|nr:LysR family transcriptional regulator [Cognatishimia activa]UZD92044.1 LysR family transcriptional regulator [Cognatishimia activa]
MKNAFHNWSDVRIFLSVLRTGSTLAASKELGIAQPTVARRIEALEHALQLTLFERNTRGFRPTADAEELIWHAEGIEAATTALYEKAATLHATTTGIIRLTAPDSVFTSQFSAILEEFIENQGKVQFEFIRRYDFVDLSAGEADVAIRFDRKIDDETLICRKITDIKGALVASDSYVAKHGHPTSENDLSGHKFVVYRGKNIPRLINNWVLDRIDPSQIAMTCSDIETLISAVKMGAGIGPMPCTYLKTNDAFVHCFDLPPEVYNTCWLLVSQSAYRRPEVKAFTSFFAPRYKAHFDD